MAIIGVLCMAGSVVAAFVQFGNTVGFLTLVLTAIITIGAFVLMMRTRTWRRLQLKTEIDGKMNDVDPEKVKVGMTGVALSRLAPMGTGQFGDEIVEVSSTQEFIEVDTEIEIVKIDGCKVIVKPKITTE